MKKIISKTEAQKQITGFFENIKDKNPKEIKKIKRLAMSYNIKLREKKKLFCKKCLNPYIGPSIHIKNGIIKITCDRCENKRQWKIK